MKHTYFSLKRLATVAGLSAVLMSPVFMQSCSSPQASSTDEKATEKTATDDGAVETQLKLASNVLNAMCPKMVDSETRLDNSAVLPGKVFQYNYTLINQVKDSLNVEAVKNALQPSIVNGIKTSPDLKYQRDNAVTLEYNYKDKNNAVLFQIVVTPDLYK